MKRLNRRKDASKAARGTVQSVVLSRAHLPKEEALVVKIQKARLFRADLVGATHTQTKPVAPNLVKTERARSGSGGKKVQHGTEYAGQYMVNCGRCGGLFKYNSRTSCSVDPAKEEFMVLCAHCKKELILYRAARRQIYKVLRQMDNAN